MVEQKKFWQGTNFWVSLVLLIGGLFVGFPQGPAREIVAGVFALIGAVFAVREWAKSTEIDFAAWVRSSNTWQYLATIITAILPTFPLALLDSGRGVVEAIFSGNLQGIIIAGLSFLTMLYNLFLKKPAANG